MATGPFLFAANATRVPRERWKALDFGESIDDAVSMATGDSGSAGAQRKPPAVCRDKCEREPREPRELRELRELRVAARHQINNHRHETRMK